MDLVQPKKTDPGQSDPGQAENMLNGKKITVVMPAMNSVATLERTVGDIDREVVDEILLVDDGSSDDTIRLAAELGLTVFAHERNYGYGRNQKTCYSEALSRGADIVVMVHPDYQYSPRLTASMAGMIAYGEYDAVIASRILGVGARKGGMPLYKYISNRFLTFFQNLVMNYKLSEYHTGFRAFSREVIEGLPINDNSDDFVFDNQMLAQVIYFNYRVGEISTPTRYFPEASSITFSRSVKYGLGVLSTSLQFRLNRMKVLKSPVFQPHQAALAPGYYRAIEPITNLKTEAAGEI